MKSSRTRIALVSGCVAATAVVVGATYAAASSPPPGIDAPKHVVNGKALPDQSKPHGDNGTPRAPMPAVAAEAQVSAGAGYNKVLSASDVQTVGLPLPFPGDLMTLSTAYLTVIKNNYVGLYTGFAPTSKSDGVIVVRDQPADGTTAPVAVDDVVTESGTGALTITGLTGVVLNLLDADGSAHTFNLQTHAFK